MNGGWVGNEVMTGGGIRREVMEYEINGWQKNNYFDSELFYFLRICICSQRNDFGENLLILSYLLMEETFAKVLIEYLS